MVATAVDHDCAIVVIGKKRVDNSRTSEIAFLDAVVTNVVVLLAGVCHAIALMDPSKVSLIAHEPFLERFRVGQACQVLISLISRPLSHFAATGTDHLAI